MAPKGLAMFVTRLSTVGAGGILQRKKWTISGIIMLVGLMFSGMHPYYVGITEIDIESKTKVVSLSCKLFTDDVQDAIFRQTGTKINLSAQRPQDKQALNNYILSKIKIIQGATPLTFKFIGYQLEEEGVWCFYESQLKGKLKQLEICNTALYESLATQTHFLHVSFEGQTQHWKLSNPESCHTFGFQ